MPDQLNPHTVPLTPVYDPSTGLYSSSNQPSMFIPQTRIPPDQNIPQAQQYIVSRQQAQPAFIPPYTTSHDPLLQLSPPVGIHPNSNYALANGTFSDSGSMLKTCLDHFATCEKLKLTALLPGDTFFKLASEYIPVYEPLANAVGSLAARSLSQQQLAYVQAAVDFKIKALNLLRQDLVYQGVSESSLLCMLTLGNVEMNDLNIDAWSQHLDGAAKAASEILGRTNVFQHPENFGNFMIILDALTYQDILSGLALCKRPRLYDVYLNHWKYLQHRPDSKLHSYKAMSSHMMGLCEILCFAADLQEVFPSSLHRLGFKYPSFYAVDKSYYTQEQHARYNDILKSITNLPEVLGINYETNVLVNTSRHALLLYFILRLDADEFLYKLSTRVENIRAIALEWLFKCPPSKFMSVQMSTNIWLIGLVCESESDRNALLTRTKELYVEVPRSSLYAIMNYLSALWKMRDSPKYKDYTYRDILSFVTGQTGFTIIP